MLGRYLLGAQRLGDVTSLVLVKNNTIELVIKRNVLSRNVSYQYFTMTHERDGEDPRCRRRKSLGLALLD